MRRFSRREAQFESRVEFEAVVVRLSDHTETTPAQHGLGAATGPKVQATNESSQDAARELPRAAACAIAPTIRVSAFCADPYVEQLYR